MIPILSHLEHHGEWNVWQTTDQRAGVLFEISPIDPEIDNYQDQARLLKTWMQSLDPRILVRVKHHARTTNEQIEVPRSESIEKFGYRTNQFILSLEIETDSLLLREIKNKILKIKTSDPHIGVLIQAVESLKNSGLRYSPLAEKTIHLHFAKNPKSWVVCESAIDHGSSYSGTVRLTKPTGNEVSIDVIESVLRSLSLDLEMSLSFSRIQKAESQVFLRKRIKQTTSTEDKMNDLQKNANEDALEKVFLGGDSLFRFELLVTIHRGDIKDLKRDLTQIASCLDLIGDTQIETYGCLPSFAAAQFGSPQHVTLFESGENLVHLMPIQASRTFDLDNATHALTVYRKDQSLFHVDLFTSSHLNANAVIVGASGRGKSGLVGTLTQCLLNDDGVSIIKVDVGGSHSKECELYQGTEYRLTLDQSSGINPFEILNQAHFDESSRAILVNFLSVLILEDGEFQVPKSVRLTLDEVVRIYAESQPLNPTLTDFFVKSLNLPRRQLFSRWVDGGIYGRAFDGAGASASGPKLRYYNFSEIFQAADPDFAQAGMAAVLAQFNLEMRLNPHRRLVLICDETPFFIQKCFDFFKFSTANVRKFGASVILVVQMSENLIVHGDSGIVENSYHRFLMSVDGNPREYQERFRLSDRQMKSLKTLQSIPGKFSEFLYQYGDNAVVARLRLTPEEYWRITTTQSERKKIDDLRRAVPDLTLEEALRCLAVS